VASKWRYRASVFFLYAAINLATLAIRHAFLLGVGTGRTTARRCSVASDVTAWRKRRRMAPVLEEEGKRGWLSICLLHVCRAIAWKSEWRWRAVIAALSAATIGMAYMAAAVPENRTRPAGGGRYPRLRCLRATALSLLCVESANQNSPPLTTTLLTTSMYGWRSFMVRANRIFSNGALNSCAYLAGGRLSYRGVRLVAARRHVTIRRKCAHLRGRSSWRACGGINLALFRRSVIASSWQRKRRVLGIARYRYRRAHIAYSYIRP
jgi:hypothetical protein